MSTTYTFTCDVCGERKEYQSRPAKPRVHIEYMGKSGQPLMEQHIDCCSEECVAIWVKAHNMEDK